MVFPSRAGAPYGRLIIWQSRAIRLSPAAFPVPSRIQTQPIMRHARQITLVLQDRDGDKPAELDLATMEELLAQKPVVSRTEAAGRMLIYSLDRRTEANENKATPSWST